MMCRWKLWLCREGFKKGFLDGMDGNAMRSECMDNFHEKQSQVG